MTQSPEPEPTPAEDTLTRDALVASLIELERHVGESGWDQPPRLFALAHTDALVAAEPALAQHLGLRSSRDGGVPGALSAIEQEHFAPGDDLGAALAGIEWPPTVHGCAIAVERTFLPSGAEALIPEGAGATEFVAAHPERQDLRVVVGAVRDPEAPGGVLSHGVARLVSEPGELLGGPELVPGLAEAVARTLTT